MTLVLRDFERLSLFLVQVSYIKVLTSSLYFKYFKSNDVLKTRRFYEFILIDTESYKYPI